MIVELLGTPNLDDMKTACEGAKAHVLRQGHKPPSMAALYTLSSQATHEAVHLLCRMLVFNPVSAVCMLSLTHYKPRTRPNTLEATHKVVHLLLSVCPSACPPIPPWRSHCKLRVCLSVHSL